MDVTGERRPRCHGAAGSEGFLDEPQLGVCCSSQRVEPRRNSGSDKLLARSLPLYFSAQSERAALGIPVPSPLADREGINLQQVAFGGGRLELACCFLQAVKIKTITLPPPYTLLLPLTLRELLWELVRMCLPFLRPDRVRSRKAIPV